MIRPEVNRGCCNTAFHLSLTCNLICLERESATSGDNNYHHQSPDHALWLKVRPSASSRKSRAGMMDDTLPLFSGDRHWGNPVFAAQHGQSGLAVACWLDNALILLRVHACSHVCTCAIRKNEWPACANERWRGAVIETQGKIGDGNGCAVCSCNAQENKKHNSHTPLFPHHAAGQQALSRDAARGEAALFPSSRFMFVCSQNKTHFGDLLNEQCEDADPDLHQSAVCRDVNGPWLWMPLVPSASHHLRSLSNLMCCNVVFNKKKIFGFSCIITWKNRVSNIFSNILDMKNLPNLASEKLFINRLYRLKTAVQENKFWFFFSFPN